MRIQVDLEERDRRMLHALATSLGVRSDILVKEAIRAYLQRHAQASGKESSRPDKVGPDSTLPLNS